MGDILQRSRIVTLEQFHALRDQRPEGEKWELIDGVPIMMPPPTLMHQRIGRNLEAMLNERPASDRPDWQADREIGVLLPADEAYNTATDVTVIDTAIEVGQHYAQRFYFVAEVLSDSNRPETYGGSDMPAPLAAKLSYYMRHVHCRGVLIVRQDRVAATLHTRGDGGWTTRELDHPSDPITVPDIGTVGALYRHTPLYAS